MMTQNGPLMMAVLHSQVLDSFEKLIHREKHHLINASINKEGLLFSVRVVKDLQQIGF
jgi:adenine-specific DNA methylase